MCVCVCVCVLSLTSQMCVWVCVYVCLAWHVTVQSNAGVFVCECDVCVCGVCVCVCTKIILYRIQFCLFFLYILIFYFILC